MNHFNGVLCRVKPLSLYQNCTKIRQLYSHVSIGMDEYIAMRKRFDQKFDFNATRFRKKMQGICRPDAPATSMVFTEDLKQMVHLVNDDPEDVQLVEKMISKFYAQNSHLRFGSFVFGPVVMRMFHYLNKPEEALRAYKNKELDGFFDQLSTHIVLLDLLFENKMYHDMIDVYKIMRDKQLSFGSVPKSVMVLVFGAYYKLNTRTHYEEARALFEEIIKRGNVPLGRAIAFMAALALNQNDPHTSFEIISTSPNQLHVLVRSIKALALCELDRIEDAVSIVKVVLQFDKPQQTKHTFPIEVIERIKEFVNESGNKQIITDYERICKQLKELNHLAEKTLDELLCAVVTVQPSISRTQAVLKATIDNSYDHKNEYRKYRPSLTELV